MFIDLDHFKLLNDAHGHTVGDQLLQLIAQRLCLLAGSQVLTARLGGDEFVVMLTHLESCESRAMNQAMKLAERVHQAILAPYQLSTHSDPSEEVKTLRYICSGSIGVALFGLKEEAVTEVLKRADVAMYQSKLSGRNVIRKFDPRVLQAQNEKMALTDDINTALVDGQLFLHYQLQTDAWGKPVGAECLLRWQHPTRGLVSPVEFVPLAEESGAILAIGEYVLRTACETLVEWSRSAHQNSLTLSVNVSPRQFIEADFVPRLKKILQQTGARPELLTLEITEGIVLKNTEQVIEKMQLLQAMGLSFSIDDFGTGYSSLSYLQRLPLREVKIDKAFVNDLADNQSSESIVRAIIALSTSMNITVVSEGVETQAQYDRLITMGCNLMQGYLIARPMALPALNQLLAPQTN
jgi:diguanylate cyclase (GGDEF)-like protein